jgi:plasmid stabilization system protein ParE
VIRRRLWIRPAADADIESAADFIACDSLAHALRFLDAVGRALAEIREHPERWPEYGFEAPELAGVRRCFVSGFPNYIVFYRVDAEGDIEVIRVLHGARSLQDSLESGSG